jgi:putative transposase
MLSTMAGRVVMRAYRYRFYPTPEQADQLNRTFGCVRYVYNRALAERAQAWTQEQRRVTHAETDKMTRNARGQYHISILVEDQITPHPPTGARVGIDAGITSLVALSTGEKITNPKYEKRDRHRLARAQKALARKQKGSANRAKARLRVARVYGKVADRRRDHLHKLTTRLVRENQTVVIEDLAVRNMVRNHSLARAISDASWSELRRQLEYKADWYGRELVVIDRWYPSSKTCSACGHLLDRLPLNVRSWTCPSCGAAHDRDVNAARTILAAGLAVSACGDGVRPPRS